MTLLAITMKFTRLSCLPTFTLVYLCLLVFTMFTTVYICLPLSTLACLPLFIIVYLLFNLVYYYITRVRVGKPERGSMEALLFHRNITENLCTSDKCDKFKGISLCSSSSSSKLLVCLDLFLVLVSCLFIYL